jgi:hypothetical protein
MSYVVWLNAMLKPFLYSTHPVGTILLLLRRFLSLFCTIWFAWHVSTHSSNQEDCCMHVAHLPHAISIFFMYKKGWQNTYFPCCSLAVFSSLKLFPLQFMHGEESALFLYARQLPPMFTVLEITFPDFLMDFVTGLVTFFIIIVNRM